MEDRGREWGQQSIAKRGERWSVAVWVGRRGQVEGCRDQRRQVTEPEAGAGKVWSGNTVGGGAGLGRLSLGQVPALWLVCWQSRAGKGRAWVVGRLEAGVLGSSSHLATGTLFQTHLDFSVA